MAGLYFEVTKDRALFQEEPVAHKTKRGYPLRKWLEMYQVMLRAQRSNGNFDLTFRDLMDAWGIHSTSAVAYRLSKLQKLGLAKSRTVGKYSTYRAVERDLVSKIPAK